MNKNKSIFWAVMCIAVLCSCVWASFGFDFKRSRPTVTIYPDA